VKVNDRLRTWAHSLDDPKPFNDRGRISSPDGIKLYSYKALIGDMIDPEQGIYWLSTERFRSSGYWLSGQPTTGKREFSMTTARHQREARWALERAVQDGVHPINVLIMSETRPSVEYAREVAKRLPEWANLNGRTDVGGLPKRVQRTIAKLINAGALKSTIVPATASKLRLHCSASVYVNASIRAAIQEWQTVPALREMKLEAYLRAWLAGGQNATAA